MRTNQIKERRRAQQIEAHARIKGEARKPEAKMRPVRSATLPLPPISVTDPASAPPAEIHFGVLLRRARERNGLTLHDVARVTRIADRWIPALEEARLDILPAPVFVGGYVRSYARAVGLDERDLLDRYHVLTQQRAIQCPPTWNRDALSPPLRRDKPFARRALFLALFVLLLFAALLGAWLLRRPS